MVSSARWFACLVVAFLIPACGTPESNAWIFAGVQPDDAREIAAMIRTRTSGEIASFSREPNGDVAVWMRVGHDPRFPDIHEPDTPFHAYVMRRVRGKWQIVDEHVLVL
jgi:hypothetical protein